MKQFVCVACLVALFPAVAPAANGRIERSTVTGNGGAFRSKGAWYQYSFTCTMAADHMSVSAFSYKVGEPIPEDRWETYGLY